jgi:RNA polymerase sigma-70 factor (ECF subfamily)
MKLEDPLKDRRQIRGLKMGNYATFNEIFMEHNKAILNYVYRLSGGNRHLAEDVAQHVFMKLWQHRNGHSPNAQIKPLLLTMARNAYIDASKKEAIRRYSPLDEKIAPGDPRQGPDAAVSRKELTSRVEDAISRLDEPIRETFILSRYQGLKYSEIAQVLDISVKTVEARLSQALKELRERLRLFQEE